MSRVTIVGGCGFAGHHLAQYLKINGNNDILCLDNLSVNNLVHSASVGNFHHIRFIEERLNILIKNQIPLIVADARNYHEMSRHLGEFKPDIIIHLAAVAHIDRANKNPYSTFDHSLRTLENSLDVARAIDAKVIYFSSSTVYGDFSKPEITEDEPLKPVGIYGNLKLAAERMCMAYNQVYGMPICIVRPQALYGPRCISERVTQKFIERAMAGQPLVVNGTGRERHDFTFIDDLCDGIFRVVNSNWTGLKIYNLTGESDTSLLELANIVAKRYPTEIVFADPDKEKPARGTMICARIRTDLGYVPKWSIEKGMNVTMDWYRDHDY